MDLKGAFVQSIADLDMGQRLSSMLSYVALNVQDILDSGTGSTRRGEALAPETVDLPCVSIPLPLSVKQMA